MVLPRRGVGIAGSKVRRDRLSVLDGIVRPRVIFTIILREEMLMVEGFASRAVCLVVRISIGIVW